MNSLPRWLISITDMPEPCQSSISSAAWRSTGSGSAAGPALKLKTRVIAVVGSVASESAIIVLARPAYRARRESEKGRHDRDRRHRAAGAADQRRGAAGEVREGRRA